MVVTLGQQYHVGAFFCGTVHLQWPSQSSAVTPSVQATGNSDGNLVYASPCLRPSFMGIGFGSGILLDVVLFANRIIAEPKSNRSILWDMEVCNDLNGVCAFF